VANQRDIKNRIASIKNTQKITSTMEMVSSAKMKKMQGRLEESKPYEENLNKIISHLAASGLDLSLNPFLMEVANPTRALVLQISGNRGLCGSFNTNVIENTLNLRKKMSEEGIEAKIYAIGKKSINFFNFIGEEIYKGEQNPEDKLTFDYAAKIGNELSKLFLSGEVHEVYISYTKVFSSAVQKPEIVKLLPITPNEDSSYDQGSGFSTDYYFEPNPQKIFSYVFPLYIKMKIFTCLLESGFSEQFSRRVAMKNATDASDDMVKDLTVTYNRVRQAKITNEIAEIVGGAAALE